MFSYWINISTVLEPGLYSSVGRHHRCSDAEVIITPFYLAILKSSAIFKNTTSRRASG